MPTTTEAPSVPSGGESLKCTRAHRTYPHCSVIIQMVASWMAISTKKELRFHPGLTNRVNCVTVFRTVPPVPFKSANWKVSQAASPSTSAIRAVQSNTIAVSVWLCKWRAFAKVSLFLQQRTTPSQRSQRQNGPIRWLVFLKADPLDRDANMRAHSTRTELK